MQAMHSLAVCKYYTHDDDDTIAMHDSTESVLVWCGVVWCGLSKTCTWKKGCRLIEASSNPFVHIHAHVLTTVQIFRFVIFSHGFSEIIYF